MMKATMIINAGPEALMRGVGPITKKAIGVALLRWHNKNRPSHFRAGAEARYGYKKRSIRYIRKKKNDGLARPLVHSGLMEKMTSASPKIHLGRNQGTATMLAPWYVKQRPVTRNAPNMVDELTRTTRGEVKKIGQGMERFIEKELKSIKHKRIVR